MTETAVGGPLAVLDLHHDLGLHPVRVAGLEAVRGRIERALVDRERCEQRAHAVELGEGEAGAHPPRVTKDGVARLVVVADEEGAQMAGAVAGSFAPTPDHELLLPADLHLAPGRRALAHQVPAVAA